MDPVREPEAEPSIVVAIVIALGVLVKPLRAITSPQGTVIGPNLKKHAATVRTIDPSGSVTAAADEVSTEAAASRSL